MASASSEDDACKGRLRTPARPAVPSKRKRAPGKPGEKALQPEEGKPSEPAVGGPAGAVGANGCLDTIIEAISESKSEILGKTVSSTDKILDALRREREPTHTDIEDTDLQR